MYAEKLKVLMNKVYLKINFVCVAFMHRHNGIAKKNKGADIIKQSQQN
jgi:hypothetical protein